MVHPENYHWKASTAGMCKLMFKLQLNVNIAEQEDANF